MSSSSWRCRQPHGFSLLLLGNSISVADDRPLIGIAVTFDHLRDLPGLAG